MKLLIQKTEQISLTKENIDEVVDHFLDQFTRDRFIKNGKVFESIDVSTSHYRSYNEEIKNPSEFLIAALRFKEALDKYREAERSKSSLKKSNRSK